MNYILLSHALKYIDFFGTNFNFYIEKNRKLYTPLGGILTILSIICATVIFLSMNLDELRHNVPISSTSVVQETYHNVKFAQEKIWLPWRIGDYEGHLANFTGLLYPIIYYYSGIKNKEENKVNLGYSFLNYKLCSETSMINNTDSFIIDASLDELYCIDMENLDMGGHWDYNFVNYVEFDLYICKNGIDYDENNKNCTSYEDLINAAQKDNSFEFEIYYPMVYYQPMNKTNPIFVKYNSYYYHLSRFSNKIDRIYLQKNTLIDDRGWVTKDEKITNFWGCEKLNGDSYATGDKKDLMNEGSSSRLYSFNIYLNFEKVVYHRYYKNLLLVLVDGLPIAYIVFNFFKFIAKVFKISSGNKKLTELLFENIQEKSSKIKRNKINELKLSTNKNIKDKKNKIHLSNKNIFENIKDENHISNKYNNSSIINDPLNINKINNKSLINNNLSELSSINLTGKDKLANMFKNFNEKINPIEERPRINFSNKKIIVNNIINNTNNSSNNNSQANNNSLNFNVIEFLNEKTKDFLSANDNSVLKNENNSEINKNIVSNKKSKKYYVQKKLFPYKYYLFSIFIKNIDAKKKSCFFTRKFIVVYNFICQLFDISSYLILQKEFQIMKNALIIGKYQNLLEKNQKINVNAHTFNADMKECLDSHKFSILGRVQENKEEG